MNTEQPADKGPSRPPPPAKRRIALALAIAAPVIVYTLGVVSGWIVHRIDTAHIALIVLAVAAIVLLLRPDALDRLKRAKAGAFEFELLERSVEKLGQQQARQADELEDIALIMPLLIPKADRAHLINLATGTTQGYRGNGALRAELRRLRSVGLIRSREGRYVAHLKDDLEFDLADHVELTGFGRRWAQRIKEIEAAEAADDAPHRIGGDEGRAP